MSTEAMANQSAAGVSMANGYCKGVCRIVRLRGFAKGEYSLNHILHLLFPPCRTQPPPALLAGECIHKRVFLYWLRIILNAPCLSDVNCGFNICIKSSSIATSSGLYFSIMYDISSYMAFNLFVITVWGR